MLTLALTLALTIWPFTPAARNHTRNWYARRYQAIQQRRAHRLHKYAAHAKTVSH